ncbi:hypothetical protein STSP2_03176 [Anaerohalosphaera lusitana]|uniref:Uncharacterized protein n=1 Tax=Anaerohalosphaera lusitana TaxID=1936003 RepID=A0A1U9NR30_9BACT|nr:helix-turn-helix transcriptional regulator [Anaerohalosphaera lusitana]AQT69976.1 hypothetical protein STSP2_03176 [Anaerohalosphaera lusitana]
MTTDKPMGSSYGRERGDLSGAVYIDQLRKYDQTIWYDTRDEEFVKYAEKAATWPEFIEICNRHNRNLTISPNLTYMLSRSQTQFRQIVKDAMAEQDLKPWQLEKLTGVPDSTIYRFLQGASLGSDKLQLILEALGLSIR